MCIHFVAVKNTPNVYSFALSSAAFYVLFKLGFVLLICLHPVSKHILFVVVVLLCCLANVPSFDLGVASILYIDVFWVIFRLAPLSLIHI